MMAKPNAVCRLAMIQVSADGIVTWRATWSGEAPSTLTLATRFGSTSRTPWKALKKTMKNTRTAASNTLGKVPRPNATRKIEPRMMRGIGVDDLDVRAEDVGEEAVLPQQEPEDDAGAGAEEEAVHRLLQGDADVDPDRAELSALGEQVDQGLPDQRGLAEEEPVDPVQVGEQLPAADDDHGETQPRQPQPQQAAATRREAACRRSSPVLGRPGSLRCWPSRRSCGTRRLRVRALDLVLERGPDPVLQLEEARLVADRLHLAARPRQVDVERSLIVPGLLVMTNTRSARATASSRSWVMNSTDGRSCSHRPSSSVCMIALVCTSRAPNGSSISRIRGELMSAAAIATRLRMPPDSWCG